MARSVSLCRASVAQYVGRSACGSYIDIGQQAHLRLGVAHVPPTARYPLLGAPDDHVSPVQLGFVLVLCRLERVGADVRRVVLMVVE